MECIGSLWQGFGSMRATGVAYTRGQPCQPQTMLMRCITATTTVGENKEKIKEKWSLTNEVHPVSHKMLLGVLQKQEKHNTI